MLRIAIFGYGNLGRGAAAAAMAATDMELCGIFTRRDPVALGGVPDGVPVYAADSAAAHKGEIDALILCGGSADDLPRQTPQLARDFCVVDSFDTHAKIPVHFAAVDAAARAGGGIHGGKMHRNLRMCVKAVHHAKVAGKLRRLPRQVVRAAAAEDQRVDLTLVRRSAVRRIDGHAVRHAAERDGVAPCKDPAELHIRRRHRCRRSAAPEIAVAENCNSQHKKRSFA